MGVENIRIPWKGWKATEEIGQGGFGTVYRIERMQSGVMDRDALKVIRIPKSKSEFNAVVKDTGSQEEARAFFSRRKNKVIREVEILKEFKGTGNIVSIEDWSIQELDDRFGWELMIRMELLTSLDKKLTEEGPLTEEEIVKLGKDICTALRMCEKKDIVHREAWGL